jgi:hypothetical protein
MGLIRNLATAGAQDTAADGCSQGVGPPTQQDSPALPQAPWLACGSLPCRTWCGTGWTAMWPGQCCKATVALGLPKLPSPQATLRGSAARGLSRLGHSSISFSCSGGQTVEAKALGATAKAGCCARAPPDAPLHSASHSPWPCRPVLAGTLQHMTHDKRSSRWKRRVCLDRVRCRTGCCHCAGPAQPWPIPADKPAGVTSRRAEASVAGGARDPILPCLRPERQSTSLPGAA